MREINKIAEGLFEKIRDRFEDVSLGDENANATSKPEDARFFNFDYTVDGENYGNITLSLIDENSLKVYFSKNITANLDEHNKKHWYEFLRELREYAKRNLLSFEPRDITRSGLKHRDLKQVSKADDTFSKDDVVTESRLYGTSLSSYDDRGPVRIIIRHSDHVDPERRGDRSRKIKAIYLETHEGERFKLPMNSLRYARAMARHVQEGGSVGDELGKHITEMATECSKLKSFRTATVHRMFEDEETQTMVEAAFEYHGLLKNTLGKMSGRKGYNQCKEQFTATSTSYIPEEELDLDGLRERFVKRSYNDRLEDALPLVHKAYNMKKQNKLAQQFESWANRLAEGTWAIPESDEDVRKLAELLQNPLPVGVDGENASNALYDLIGDDALFDQFNELAEVDPEADARDLITTWLADNTPDVYQQLLTDIGDDPNYPAEPAEQEPELDEGNTYGTTGEVYDEDKELNENPAILAAMGRAAGGALAADAGAGALGRAAGSIAGQAVGQTVANKIAQATSDEDDELEENYGALAPNDSASPLTNAQHDACDRGPDMERDLEEQLAEEWQQMLEGIPRDEDSGEGEDEDDLEETSAGESLPPSQIPGKEKLLKTPVTKAEKFAAKAKDFVKGVTGQKDVETFGSLKEQDSLAEMRRLAGLK